MQYKILDVAPGQVKVEYEDGSWAIVPIAPGASLEDIDHEVSKYDPDFIKKQEDVCNPDVYIGQERSSVRKETDDPTPIKIEPVIPPDGIAIKPLTPGRTSHRPFSLDSISKYLARNGDTRLLDVLDSFIEDYLEKTNTSVEDLITEARENNPLTSGGISLTTLSDEELLAQAEAELEAESNNSN